MKTVSHIQKTSAEALKNGAPPKEVETLTKTLDTGKREVTGFGSAILKEIKKDLGKKS